MRGLLLGIGMFLAVAIVGNAAEKKVDPKADDASERFSTKTVHDRITRLRLQEGAEFMDAGRFSAALRPLQAVLDDPTERFVIGKNGEAPTAHAVALQLITEKGPEAVRVYRRQYGDLAQGAFQQALSTGRIAEVAAVARRFFLTDAGFHATNRLASFHLDQGNFQGCLFYLEQLFESPTHRSRFDDLMKTKRAFAYALAGRVEEARASLKQLTAHEITLGGELQVTRMALPEFLQPRLESRGATAKSATTTLEEEDDWLPVAPAETWLDDVDQLATAMKLDKPIEEALADRSIFSGAEPIVVGDVLCCRFFSGMRAFDLRTGAVRWTCDEGRHFQSELKAAETFLRSSEQGRVPSRPEAIQLSAATMTLANGVVGRLTTDGTRVYRSDYALERFSLSKLPESTRTPQFALAMPGLSRITAVDLATGVERWQVGGMLERDPTTRPIAQMYFFGPPVAVGGKLYVVGEAPSKAVSLICLEPATGSLLWMAPIPPLPNALPPDPLRWWQACDVLDVGGLVIFGTPYHDVIAFDPTLRQVLWRYSMDADRIDANKAIGDPAPGPVAIRVVGRQVVAASASCGGLHAIDLYTGRRLWRATRGRGLRLVAANNEQVILQSRTNVQARRLRDGRAQSLIPVKGAVGKGYFTPSRYHVLSGDGFVHALDPRTGQRLTTAPLMAPRRLGALVSSEHGIVFAGVSGVQSYPRHGSVRKDIERLALAPDDPRGLYQRARLHWTAGHSESALRDLVAVLGRAPDEHRQKGTRLLLDVADSFQDESLATAGEAIESLKPLAQDEQIRSVYHRLLAQRGMVTKDYRRAAAALGEFGTIPLPRPVAETESVLVRHPVPWSQRFLGMWYATSEQEEIDAFRQAVAAELSTPSAMNRKEQMIALVRSCQALPFGEQVAAVFGRALAHAAHEDDAEQLALVSAESAQPAIAIVGARTLDLIAKRRGAASDRVAIWKRLARRWLCGSLAGQRTLMSPLANKLWYEAPAQPERRPGNATLSANEGKQNDLQRALFVPTSDALPSMRQRYVTLGQDGQSTTFAVISSNSGQTEQEGWIGKLIEPDANAAGPLYWFGRRAVLRQDNQLIGFSLGDPAKVWLRDFVANDSSVRAEIAAIGPDFLALTLDDRMQVIDPRTGHTLWEKRRFNDTDKVFGNHRALFVVSKSNGFVAYRTRDGAVLKRGALAEDVHTCQRGSVGQAALMSQFAVKRGGMGIWLWDLESQKDVWSRAFPLGTHCFASDDDAILALEPSGPLWAIHRQTGRLLIADDVGDEAKQVSSARVCSDARHRYIVVNRLSVEPALSKNFQRGTMAVLPLNGPLRAYDKQTGKLQWSWTLLDRMIMIEPDLGMGALVCFGQSDGPAGEKRMTIEVLDKFDGRTLGSLQLKKDLADPCFRHDGRARWFELFDADQIVRIQLDAQQ